MPSQLDTGKHVEQDEQLNLEQGAEIEKRTTRLKGVFSSQSIERIGTGTTTRKTIQKMYWYCEEVEGEIVLVQSLNVNNIPSGEKEEVPLEDFLSKYNPEPEFYQQHVYPKLQELDNAIRRAEDSRQQGAMYSAEFEYSEALAIDEENVKANFGLGLTYMERGENDKASDIFDRLVGLEAAFSPEHKHLFNEFGISLRKSNLHDQAVTYYSRALELVVDDENLFYNMARAYYAKGERDKCEENLRHALALNSNFEVARKFLDFINA